MSTYRVGDYVEPADEAHRAVRHPGQILMAQALPDDGQKLTVLPFDGTAMWAMPDSSVRQVEPPVRDTETP
ncbi:hypothetical protein [Embleya scabrispora]|uniref:hypothetical protein n=1 Tax=Embleya scabrispora TaxID=159449 RepID=UPI00037221C6|nr:hypothetical protein [Embleya scabrispora]MYS82161.1 hypothetical protein [Streptomyces sp. SID5474]